MLCIIVLIAAFLLYPDGCAWSAEATLSPAETAAAFRAAGYKAQGKKWFACAEGHIAEVREHGEHRMTRRALETPDGHPAQAHSEIVRVARQVSATTTYRFVFQLKAEGQDACDHAFDKRLAIAKQLKIGRLVLEIDGDSAVFAGLAGSVGHGSPSGQMVVADDDPRWGYDGTIARGSGRVSGLHH
jgi:hypothetical protein